LSRITHTATFNPQDSPARIREELACPACGHRDLGAAHLRITDDTIRIFCSGCGSFVTIVMTEAQAHAVRRCSATLSTIDARTPQPL
jgi:transcription elongation factor Elf1